MSQKLTNCILIIIGKQYFTIRILSKHLNLKKIDVISTAWSETQPVQVGHSSRDNHLRPFSFPTQVYSVYLLLDCFPNCITIDHVTNGGITYRR